MPTSSRRSPEPLLVVRADGSAAIGLGHLMRMRAVAQAAVERGLQVLCATRAEPAVAAGLAGQGCAVLSIPQSVSPAAEPAWLAATLGRRAFVLLDGYTFDELMLRGLRSAGFRTGLIVDQPGAPESLADLVVHPNLHAPDHGRQASSTQVRLAGPAYALLRREFRDARQGLNEARRSGLLVTFGGSDVAGLTPPVVSWLRDALPGTTITAVIGPAASSFAQCQRLQSPTVRIVAGSDRMSDLMSTAELAISAAGTTVLELACLGVPSLLVTVADNQDGIAAAASRAGFALDLGRAATLTADAVVNAVRTLRDPARQQAARTAGLSTVDGQGSLRVVDQILSFGDPP